MPKFSYFLGAILLSGAVMTQPALARDGGNWHGGEQSSHDWNDRNRGHGAEHGNYKYQKKNYYKPNGHSGHNQSWNDNSHWKGQQNHGKTTYVKPSHKPAPVYHAPPPKTVYVKPVRPYRYKHYYRPKYVYVTPHYGNWHYGYYPYRGFFWPFVHVSFVLNLSSVQIELHHQAVYAALDAPVGKVISWSRGGRSGTVVVINSGYDSSGNLCKEYRQTIYYNGRTTTEVAVSCLSSGGYWISP